MMDNGVHQAIRRIPEAEAQIHGFFSTGRIVSRCSGPCDPE
jgi:hypothetical protein